jgi:quercetin dioxygenase-like cupin family protein
MSDIERPLDLKRTSTFTPCAFLEKPEAIMRGLSVAVAVIAVSSSSAFAQDHPGGQSSRGHQHSGPAHAQLVLDNPTVSVKRFRMAPHERTPTHDLSARIVVWLTNAHLRDTLATGESRDESVKAGDVEWVPAQRHEGENLGDDPIEFIAIIPKQIAR